MLNEREEKLLKYLFENDEGDFIDVTDRFDNIKDVFDIVESLNSKKYVEKFNTFSSVKAKITQEGKSYFILKKERNREKVRANVIDWSKYIVTTTIAILALIIAIIK